MQSREGEEQKKIQKEEKEEGKDLEGKNEKDGRRGKMMVAKEIMVGEGMKEETGVIK